VLSEELANQIAAGEVVERPASVLKELMENALDAQAGRIVVEVAGGGRSLIRVVDDGWGMGPDDLLLALERHATSKVASAEELARVMTMGFRGEALPSIAAVIRLTLRSRARGAEAGSEVRVAGGSIREVKEVGCPEGTLVEVADLFYNTPARRKFLKSQNTEAGHLGQACLRLALARPSVALRYVSGGQTLYDLPPAAGLGERAATVLGREAVEQMVEVAQSEGPLTISGLAGLPGLSRPATDQVYTFVNGRYVRDRVLISAINQAYRGLMADDRRPVAVLHISLDPELVDVNVHPAKVEVRFSRSQEVHQALAVALRRALAQGQGNGQASRPSPALPPPQASPQASSQAWPQTRYADAPSPAAPEPPVGLVREPGVDAGADFEPAPARHWPRTSPGAWPRPGEEQPAPLPPVIPLAPRPRPLFGPAGELTVIGQLHGLYILCSSPSGLVVVDQHAAHERLTYETLRRQLQAGDLPRQGLLAPASLELTPQETAWAEKQQGDWARLGLEIAPFGGRTWTVSALPAFLAGRDPAALLRDLLSEMSKSGLPPATPEFLETALRALACRASLKQGQRLAPAEMEDLVTRAAALAPPVTCPHGRPVFLLLARRDLARYFQRGSEDA
jgi:DNA mismatch repair protein MutL